MQSFKLVCPQRLERSSTPSSETWSHVSESKKQAAWAAFSFCCSTKLVIFHSMCFVFCFFSLIYRWSVRHHCGENVDTIKANCFSGDSLWSNGRLLRWFVWVFKMCFRVNTSSYSFCNMSVPRTWKHQLLHNTCNLATAWCLNGLTVCYWKQAAPLRLSSSCPAVDKQALALILTMPDIAACYIMLVSDLWILSSRLLLKIFQRRCMIVIFVSLFQMSEWYIGFMPCLVNIMARALHFVIGQGIEPCLSLWACFHVYQEDYIRLCSLNCSCLFPATLLHVFAVYEYIGYALSNFFVHLGTCHFTSHGHIFREVVHPFPFQETPLHDLNANVWI